MRRLQACINRKHCLQAYIKTKATNLSVALRYVRELYLQNVLYWLGHCETDYLASYK